jgi:hypothetical protein
MAEHEALTRLLSAHQPRGRICIGCTGCPDVEFMTSVDHAEHVAELITAEFIVTPKSAKNAREAQTGF